MSLSFVGVGAKVGVAGMERLTAAVVDVGCPHQHLAFSWLARLPLGTL